MDSAYAACDMNDIYSIIHEILCLPCLPVGGGGYNDIDGWMSIAAEKENEKEMEREQRRYICLGGGGLLD